MRIVFWQICLSPHQLPYITHLFHEINEIVIAVDESTLKNREEMGWDISDYSNSDKMEIHINPNQETINNLFKKNPENSYHLFSGIRGFSFVFHAFKCSLSYNVKRGLITEGPNTFAFGLSNGKPIWLHKMRFFLQDRKYIPYIQSVFAIGEEAVTYYQSISNTWKVFPFAYCTKGKQLNKTKQTNNYEVKFIFIGSLSWWKAVNTILHASELIKDKTMFSITIIGDGKERSKLEQFAQNKEMRHVHFLGIKSNEQIPNILQEHDILILPSIYDGWGAVVNEALMQGKYVICSDKCGAKALLKNPLNGTVFKGGKFKELANQMQYCIDNIPAIREQESQRKEWAEKHISGKVIAQYMIDCLRDRQIKAPWE